jgi:hypothetical protein
MQHTSIALTRIHVPHLMVVLATLTSWFRASADVGEAISGTRLIPNFVKTG